MEPDDDEGVAGAFEPAISVCGLKKTDGVEDALWRKAEERETFARVLVEALLLEMLQLLKMHDKSETTVASARAVDCPKSDCKFQTCAPTTIATLPPCTCIGHSIACFGVKARSQRWFLTNAALEEPPGQKLSARKPIASIQQQTTKHYKHFKPKCAGNSLPDVSERAALLRIETSVILFWQYVHMV